MMEGINWGEVNAQANDIMKYLTEFKNDVFKNSDDFVNELSIYWASGNAVSFEKEWNNKMQYILAYTEPCEEEFGQSLSNAGSIYANIFNTNNELFLKYNPKLLYKEISGVLKETNNGITGMNKEEVNNCVLNYKNSIKDLLNDLQTNINSIHISIFDTADAQREAFNSALSKMTTEINNKVEELCNYIENEKTKEQDNLELAKQQTTNTFNG